MSITCPEGRSFSHNKMNSYFNDPIIQALNQEDSKEFDSLITTLDVTANNDLAIRYASFYSNLESCRKLICSGANPFANNNEPIFNAIHQDKLDIVEFLFHLGLEKFGEEFKDYFDSYNLGGFVTSAAFNGSINSLKFLVDNNCNIHLWNDSAFKYACINEHFDCADYLLLKSKMNFYLEEEIIFKEACKNNKVNILEYLYNNQKKNSHFKHNIFFPSINKSFIDACYYGNYEVVQFLIDKGIKINDLSPLIYCFHNFNHNIFNLLSNKFENQFLQYFKLQDKLNKHNIEQDIYKFLEKGNNINTTNLRDISQFLMKIGVSFHNIDKIRFPKIYTLIETIYLNTILINKNNKSKINKI